MMYSFLKNVFVNLFQLHFGLYAALFVWLRALWGPKTFGFVRAFTA
jgi:hypothetical protein